MNWESRKLALSDLATEQEAEVIKNPYQFLNLPMGSSPEDVRRNYITMARRYHPDLVHPQFDSVKLQTLYSQEDAKAGNLKYSIDEMIKALESAETRPEEHAGVLEEIRTMAHRKMVLLNRAYEEIKARHNPAEWSRLFGYDFERVFTANEGGYRKVVVLEGRGEVDVYPNHFEYWVAGPYLSFDWGPDDDHPWVEWDYRHEVNLRHMFAHLEVNEGKPISRVLLEPLFDCFGLDASISRSLIDLLSDGNPTAEVMRKLGVPHDKNVNPRVNKREWIYSLEFRRHLNEISTLSTEPDWDEKPIDIKVKDGKLTLEDYTQTNFSEADYILFLTLAYGPLLK